MAKKSRANDYEIIGDLDESKSGSLLKVMRKSNIYAADNSTYAMKVVKIPQSDKRNQEELINEVKILTNLKQPDSFRYFDSFVEKNALHVIMELNDKGDLSNQLKSQMEGNHLIQLCLRQKRARESLSQIRDNLPDISALKKPKIERSKAFYWGNFKSRYNGSSTSESNDKNWRKELSMIELSSKNQEEVQISLNSEKMKKPNESCVEEIMKGNKHTQFSHGMKNPINELQNEQKTIAPSNTFYPSFFVQNPKEVPIEDSGFVLDNDELINIESDATPTFNTHPSDASSFLTQNIIQTQVSTNGKESGLISKSVQDQPQIPINQSAATSSFFTQDKKETTFKTPQQAPSESKIISQAPKNSVTSYPSFFVQNPQEIPIEDSGFIDESSNDSTKIQENSSAAQNNTVIQDQKASLFQSSTQSSFKSIFDKKPDMAQIMQSPIFTRTTSMPLYTKTAPSLNTQKNTMPSFFATNPTGEIPLEDPGFMDDEAGENPDEVEENLTQLETKPSLFNSSSSSLISSPSFPHTKSIFDRKPETQDQNKTNSLFGVSLISQTTLDAQPKQSLFSAQTQEPKSLFDKSTPSLFSTQNVESKSLFDKSSSLFSGQTAAEKTIPTSFLAQSANDSTAKSLFSDKKQEPKSLFDKNPLFSAQKTDAQPTFDKQPSLFGNKQEFKSIFDSTPAPKQEEKPLVNSAPSLFAQNQEFNKSSATANNQNSIFAAKLQVKTQSSSFFVQTPATEIPFEDPGFADDSKPNSEDEEETKESQPSAPQNSLFSQSTAIPTATPQFKSIFEMKSDEKPKVGSIFDMKSAEKPKGGSLFDIKNDEKPKEGSLFDIKHEEKSSSIFGIKSDEKSKGGSLFAIKSDEQPKMSIFGEIKVENSLQTPKFMGGTQKSAQVSSFFVSNPTSEIPLEDPGFLDQEPEKDLSETHKEKSSDESNSSLFKGVPQSAPPSNTLFKSIFDKNPEVKSSFSSNNPLPKTNTSPIQPPNSFFVANPTTEIPFEDPGFTKHSNENSADEEDSKEITTTNAKPSIFGTPMPNEKIAPLNAGSLFGRFSTEAIQSQSAAKTLFSPLNVVQIPYKFNPPGNPPPAKANTTSSFFVSNPPTDIPLEDPGFVEESDKDERENPENSEI